ncbi:MAG: hypothetical protein ACK2UC_08570 [Anaerolineae bacterium]
MSIAIDAEELADVVIYCLSLSIGFELDPRCIAPKERQSQRQGHFSGNSNPAGASSNNANRKSNHPQRVDSLLYGMITGVQRSCLARSRRVAALRLDGMQANDITCQAYDPAFLNMVQ